MQAAADYRLTPRCQQPNAQNKVLMSGLIALSDRDPRSLISLPRERILETMCNWREHWLANPSKLDNRFFQPFAVWS